MRLKDKVAIVTGGTRGIGRAIALKLADHGANIVINYRNSDKEAEALKAILEEKGVKVLTVKCDISNFEDSKLSRSCKAFYSLLDRMSEKIVANHSLIQLVITELSADYN